MSSLHSTSAPEALQKPLQEFADSEISYCGKLRQLTEALQRIVDQPNALSQASTPLLTHYLGQLRILLALSEALQTQTTPEKPMYAVLQAYLASTTVHRQPVKFWKTYSNGTVAETTQYIPLDKRSIEHAFTQISEYPTRLTQLPEFPGWEQARNGQESLHSLMMAPVQRVMRYQMPIQEAHKTLMRHLTQGPNTPDSAALHALANELEASKKSFEKLSESVNANLAHLTERNLMKKRLRMSDAQIHKLESHPVLLQGIQAVLHALFPKEAGDKHPAIDPGALLNVLHTGFLKKKQAIEKVLHYAQTRVQLKEHTENLPESYKTMQAGNLPIMLYCDGSTVYPSAAQVAAWVRAKNPSQLVFCVLEGDESTVLRAFFKSLIHVANEPGHEKLYALLEKIPPKEQELGTKAYDERNAYLGKQSVVLRIHQKDNGLFRANASIHAMDSFRNGAKETMQAKLEKMKDRHKNGRSWLYRAKRSIAKLRGT